MAIETLRRALDAEDGRYGLTVDLNKSFSNADTVSRSGATATVTVTTSAAGGYSNMNFRRSGYRSRPPPTHHFYNQDQRAASTSYSNNSLMTVGRSPTTLLATPEIGQGDSRYSNPQPMYNCQQLRKI